MGGFLNGLLGEDALTGGVTIFALIVVWIPFIRGMKITFQAWAATRFMDRKALASGLKQEPEGDVGALALLMLRIYRDSLGVQDDNAHSREFVFDASRQYVMNEFDLYYTRPITMFASLMPPIGFIGTTVGMLILFISMHKADTTLELGALAIALTSSIFALIAYAILEGIKIRLYTRLLLCLRVVAEVCGVQGGPRQSGKAGEAPLQSDAQAAAGATA
jgi:biopolymer transport protein ExbB/TolQ